jgi:hypothetical protein
MYNTDGAWLTTPADFQWTLTRNTNTDQSGSFGKGYSPQRVTISSHLRDKKAATRISHQILGVHGHFADEEDGATRRIKRERHQRTKQKSWMLAG